MVSLHFIIMDKKTGDKNVCLACACPCEKHAKHNHPVAGSTKSDTSGGANVCNVCGSDSKCNCK